MTSSPLLRKGKWSASEDALLLEYVKSHGPKPCWSLIQNRMGNLLSRDAKSCRLRYENHLKPGLQQGPLTESEKQKIIFLQKQAGNKWAFIASHLNGRSDNCVKNWFNSHVKKRKRCEMGGGSGGLETVSETQEEYGVVMGRKKLMEIGTAFSGDDRVCSRRRMEEEVEEGGESFLDGGEMYGEVVEDSWSTECSVVGRKFETSNIRRKNDSKRKLSEESDVESSSNCGTANLTMFRNEVPKAINILNNNFLNNFSDDAESAAIQIELPPYRKLKENLRSGPIFPTNSGEVALHQSDIHNLFGLNSVPVTDTWTNFQTNIQFKAAIRALLADQHRQTQCLSLFQNLQNVEVPSVPPLRPPSLPPPLPSSRSTTLPTSLPSALPTSRPTSLPTSLPTTSSLPSSLPTYGCGPTGTILPSDIRLTLNSNSSQIPVPLPDSRFLPRDSVYKSTIYPPPILPSTENVSSIVYRPSVKQCLFVGQMA